MMAPAFGPKIFSGIFDDPRQGRTVAMLDGRVVAWVVWGVGPLGRREWERRLAYTHGAMAYLRMVLGSIHWLNGPVEHVHQ